MKNKSELYYIVSWGKNKEKAWSGTKFSLLKSLQNHYNIREIEINQQPSFVKKIGYKLKILENDFCSKKIHKIGLNIKKHIPKGSNILQFDEIIEDNSNFKTYIYQDLSALYISYIAENFPELFKYSGFDRIGIKGIKKRANIQRIYYQNCSGILTMGNWIRKELITKFHISPNKIYHVGGGINLDKNLIKKQQKFNNKILFVGRDFTRKGGYLVYEAFNLLKKDIPHLELHIAGPSINPIKNPITGLHFWGDCTHEQLSYLFNKCDIFCMPSYFEAYGLVFIEALTYGLPCIGRNMFEMPYFIEEGETGYLLKQDSPIELSNLISQLIDNRTIKQNVINRQSWYIDEYSWNHVAKRISNIIK